MCYVPFVLLSSCTATATAVNWSACRQLSTAQGTEQTRRRAHDARWFASDPIAFAHSACEICASIFCFLLSYYFFIWLEFDARCIVSLCVRSPRERINESIGGNATPKRKTQMSQNPYFLSSRCVVPRFGGAWVWKSQQEQWQRQRQPSMENCNKDILMQAHKAN